MLIVSMKDFAVVIPAVATVNMTSKPVRVLGETALIQTDGNALLKAAWLGRLRLMRLLIEGGTDVNKTNDEGRTALMVACSSTYKDTQSTTKSKIVKFLLENKCDPNVQDRHGRTALMYACQDHAGTEVVSVFLKWNSDVRLVDKKGSSALVYAVNAGDPDVLRLLVDACKAQGKEVIIITTNKGIGSREPVTRQYLDVPPTLSQSPPYGMCVTPSEINLKHDSHVLQVSHVTPSLTLKSPEDQVQNQDSLKNQSKVLSAVVSHHLERSASFEGLGTENDFSLHRTQSPRNLQSPNEASESKLASAVYQRRLGRRGSCASLTDEGSQSPRHRGNTSPSQTSIKSLSELQLQVIGTPDRTPSPPHQPPRRPLQRRQSAEAFNTATLQGLSPSQPVRQKLAATNSNPIEGQLEINTPRPNVLPMSAIPSSRRCSLPGMPPPLRKCHTVHSINVSELLENKPSLPATSCPNNLQSSHCDLMEETAEYDDEEDTEGQALKQAVSKGLLEGGPGGLIAMHRRQRCGERRGSAPFILEDELAQTRPGRLPPLKVSPSVPLPGIGRLREPAVRSGPSSPSRIGRVDRRHSMQPEDLRSMTSFAARSRGSFRNKHNSQSNESTDSI